MIPHTVHFEFLMHLPATNARKSSHVQSLTDDVKWVEQVQENSSLHLFKVNIFFEEEGSRDSPSKSPSNVGHVCNGAFAVLPVVILQWQLP